MTDPLSKYQKSPIEPRNSTSVARPENADPYVAFSGKDKVERLQIRMANEPTYSALYILLHNIAIDAEFGENFLLMFPFMNVRVRGKNLQPVVAAVEKRQADFIQEYDMKRFGKTISHDLPFIESIEIIGLENSFESQEGPGGGGKKPH